jgi:transcriptional regulator with PAS, ATPase and Fis domain
LGRVLGLNVLKKPSDQLQESQGVPSGTLKMMVDSFEYDTIVRTLKACGNNHQLAAEKLGIGKTILWRKLQGHSGNDAVA